MIEIIVDNRSSINTAVIEEYATSLSEKINKVDFSIFKIEHFKLFLIVNMDNDSLKNATCIDDNKKKYILYQNIPVDYSYSTKFEAKLSSLRVKVQFSELPFYKSINNLVYVFDFGHDSQRKKSEDNVITAKPLPKEIKEDDAEAMQRRAMFVAVEPKYSLDKVIMSEQMKEEINDALSIIKNRLKIYEEWGFSEVDPQPKAILSFWGPPGTGKTMCAHGIAAEMHSKILAVNYAEIESKYAGESPKNLIAAFNVAQENNAILFFDEADSFLGKRISNVQSGHDQSINSLRSQMLILLEEFEGIVIFATNLVKNFDPAFQTRILRHIKFELPNEEARKAIFKSLIPRKAPVSFDDPDYAFTVLAKESDGFSGRDIRNSILDTLSSAARENRETLSICDFTQAIQTRKEAYTKLKEEQQQENKKMAEEIKNSIIAKSKQDLHQALVSVALYAIWSDDTITKAEESLVLDFAKSLNVELPNGVDINYLQPLPRVVEFFNTREKKFQALDIAIRIVVADGVIDEKESAFLVKIFDMLEISEIDINRVIDYANHLAQSNSMWINILS